MSPTPLRHTCLACGGSCRGARVQLLPEEVPRIEQIAAAMGIDTPIRNGHLRHVDDTCVFAAPDGLCSIHRDYGAAAKPAVCAQYPLVALRVGETRRVGIDPGCYTAWSTWRTGPELEPGLLLLTPASADPGLVRLEDMLLGLLDAQGWRGLLAGLVGPGFEGRWIAALRALDLRELLGRPRTSRDIRAALARLVEALDGELSMEASPAFDPEMDAWIAEVTRRMIYLRLASGIPTPAATALLTLGGALVLGAVDPRPAHMGPGLAAWVRSIRTPQVWAKILTSPEALRQLAAG